MVVRKVTLILLTLFSFVVISFLIYMFLDEGFAISYRPKVWRGQYSSGFELSSFRACDSKESWWATGNLEKIYSVITPPHDITPEIKVVYVELIGKVSFSGAYGHLGAYNRQINVTDIYLVQKDIPKDCQ